MARSSRRFFGVGPHDISHQHLYPAVPVRVALRTEDMPILRAARTFLRFDDKEGMPIFIVVFRNVSTGLLLTSNLGAGNCNGAKMGSSALGIIKC